MEQSLRAHFSTDDQSRVASCADGGAVFYRYKLHEADGSDAGEAHYAFLVKPGETIVTGIGRKLRVIDVIPFTDEDESPFVAMLRVEVA